MAKKKSDNNKVYKSFEQWKAEVYPADRELRAHSVQNGIDALADSLAEAAFKKVMKTN